MVAWAALAMVGGSGRIVNATADPDGSYRHYFLHVPPHVRTAREAVAWTFGFESADDYLVTIET